LGSSGVSDSVEQSFAELAVSVRKARLVRAQEGVAVDVAGRILAHELAVHLDDAVRRKAAATQQVVDVVARQLPALAVAHLFRRILHDVARVHTSESRSRTADSLNPAADFF